jgi:hypothetical protein
MAEVNSRQAAKIALGQKLSNHEAGRRRTVVFQTPAVFTALAINDTLAGGVFIPKGARVVGARVSNSAGTASSTINVGLRNRLTGAVLSATAISSAIAITTATTTSVDAGNGAYIAAGVNQVVSDDAEVYLTALGAVLAANQLVRVEVDYIGT